MCGRKIKCSRSRAMLLKLPVGLDLVGFVWSVERIVTLSILYALNKISYSPRESEGVCIFTGVGLLSICMCLSVSDHDNYNDCGRIFTKFYWKVPRGKGRPCSCFVTIGRGAWQ